MRIHMRMRFVSHPRTHSPRLEEYMVYTWDGDLMLSERGFDDYEEGVCVCWYVCASEGRIRTNGSNSDSSDVF